MGVVWQAHDERLYRAVAIKQLVLSSTLSDLETKEVTSRAMQEGRITARVQHPHVVTVHDVVEHHGQPCLIMEYLPSRSLATVLSIHGVLAPDIVAGIGSQIASALAAAHQAGVMHRDIKPGNVLVTDDGTAKITDFGVSRAVGDLTVTATGILAGTPAYLAPAGSARTRHPAKDTAMTTPRQGPPTASVAEQLTPTLRLVRRWATQWVRRSAGVALAAAAALATLTAPANAAETGPALQTSQAVLASALTCPNGFHHPDKQVVLLGAGTGLWGTETYAKGLNVVLSNADFDWCTIDVPDRLLGDVQTNTEFTVAAVRWIHRQTGRPISLVSHSQGAMEARWAVQWWPDVRATVDHVITIEGANQGLPTANVLCAIPCIPFAWQGRVGSNFMTALNSDPMPAGPVYTAISSITDVGNVAPTVYFIPGNENGNVFVQDKCPGRPVDHIQSVFDAAELGIVMDALTHPGQVDLTRVPNAVCGQLYAAGINPIDATTSIASLYAKNISGIVLGEKATAEPPLRPYAQAAER